VGHYYFDSSALVKRHIAEPGTAWINSLCQASAGHTIYLVRISAAEFIAAVFRRARIGDLIGSDAQSIAARFKSDFRNSYQIVEVTEQLIDSAMILAEKYSLRGYDAVQLAAAVELQVIRVSLSLSGITFVCADDRLNTAAMAEGLFVENPNNH
jgi:hypothetical protein